MATLTALVSLAIGAAGGYLTYHLTTVYLFRKARRERLEQVERDTGIPRQVLRSALGLEHPEDF